MGSESSVGTSFSLSHPNDRHQASNAHLDTDASTESYRKRKYTLFEVMKSAGLSKLFLKIFSKGVEM